MEREALARQIFEEIRERPYMVTTDEGDATSQNCYNKGIELARRLCELRYAVRACVGQIDWNNAPLPDDVKSLIPHGVQDHHFYIEILQDDGQWRALDPSYESGLAKHGFQIGTFDNGQLCFNITKAYTVEEQVAAILKWNDNDFRKDYFKKSTPFLMAVNRWFESL